MAEAMVEVTGAEVTAEAEETALKEVGVAAAAGALVAPHDRESCSESSQCRLSLSSKGRHQACSLRHALLSV